MRLTAFLGGLAQFEFRRELRAKLVGQHSRLHLFDRAGRELAERKRPERDADQPVDGKPEMLGKPLHLAVLAFAQPERQPEIGALRAVDARLDRAVVDAVDGDAVAQARRAPLASPCHARARDSA